MTTGSYQEERAKRQDWTLCHRVDTTRTLHTVDLAFIETCWQSASGEMSFYRCQQCGQYYLYEYDEFNSWGSHGDQFEMYHYWYPISSAEMGAIREDINYQLSPREHLTFGPY